MNKQRKILTVAALVAFGAIIGLHYVGFIGGFPHFRSPAPTTFPYYTSNGGIHFQTVTTDNVITDVRLPLFALAVFYVGLFFILGPDKNKTRPPKMLKPKPTPTGTTASSSPSPPHPAEARAYDLSSRDKIWIAAIVIALIGSIAAVGLWQHQPVTRPPDGLIPIGPLQTSSSSASPRERAFTPREFGKYAKNLREQALLKVEPLFESAIPPATQRYPWKTNIVTTVFWIGEQAGDGNSVPKYSSCWDANWTSNYGGFDNPEPPARRSYVPIAFIPRQNPFYCALPYNDVTHGQFKPEAPLVIPWFKQAYTGPGQSVCWHRWIAIRKGNRTCYAQWEDCGPFLTDHFHYVFGNERPKPNARHGAGLSVSPAVRDYLLLAPTDVTDWQFVEVRDVLPGPWRSYGENNHFVIARRQNEDRVIQRTQEKNKPKK